MDTPRLGRALLIVALAATAACGAGDAPATPDAQAAPTASATASAPVDPSALVAQVTGYELLPAPDLESRFDAQAATEDAVARQFTRDGTTLGSVIVIPDSPAAAPRSDQDFLDAALAASKAQGRTAALKSLDGVPAVETVGSPTTKGWSLPVGRYGLLVTGESAAATDVARQLVRILGENP